MNKKGNLALTGTILFFLAIAVWGIYMFNVYLPTIRADPTNSDALMKAVLWGLGCGVVGTIGIIMVKQSPKQSPR